MPLGGVTDLLLHLPSGYILVTEIAETDKKAYKDNTHNSSTNDEWLPTAHAICEEEDEYTATENFYSSENAGKK